MHLLKACSVTPVSGVADTKFPPMAMNTRARPDCIARIESNGSSASPAFRQLATAVGLSDPRTCHCWTATPESISSSTLPSPHLSRTSRV